MYNDNYIKIYFSDFENDFLTSEPFSKLHAWADLLFIANAESNILVRGSNVCTENGEVRMSLRDLCKRWNWGNTRMNSFMAYLENKGKISIKKDKLSTSIVIYDYATYFETKSQNASPAKSPSGVSDVADIVEVTKENEENFELIKSPTKSPVKSLEKTETPTKSPAKSPSGVSDVADIVEVTKENEAQKNENASPAKSLRASNKEEREERKENKKENFPHTPIKERNKEKKEEIRRNPLTPNVVSCSIRAHTCVREKEGEKFILTCEEPTKEKKEKKSQEKEYALTWRARLVFSDFYKQRYGEDKYWKVSEMTALKQLLKQIKYSREHRDVPLPTDDDSILSAFTEFLNRICTPWILQNFLVTNINSKYDTIVQDIKNNSYGTSIFNAANANNAGCKNYQSGQNVIEHQKKALIDELREFEAKFARGEINTDRPEGKSSEIELPDF